MFQCCRTLSGVVVVVLPCVVESVVNVQLVKTNTWILLHKKIEEFLVLMEEYNIEMVVLVWTSRLLPPDLTLPWTPLRRTARNFALCFPSPTTISLFLCLSGCLLERILVVFLQARTLQCARLGSRVVV